MDENALRQRVIDELAFEPSVDAAHIGVAVNGSVVTLSGRVGSYAEKLAAERAARRVKGVHAIAEEIEIRYPEQKKSGDDEIAARAVAILAWDVMIPRDAIQIKVQHGWLTLTGAVQWFFQKEAAEEAVRKLSGVQGVTNRIEIVPQVLVSDVRQRIEAALKRHAELEANTIHLQVTGGKVVMEGRVNSWHERYAAQRAAWSVAGVSEVEDHLTIA